MKRKILSIIIMGVMIFSSGSVMSQPPPPPPPPDGTAGPIDNGSVALLIAVGCYGYMQLRKKEIA